MGKLDTAIKIAGLVVTVLSGAGEVINTVDSLKKPSEDHSDINNDKAKKSKKSLKNKTQ